MNPLSILNSIGSLHNDGQQAGTVSPYGERAESCERNSGCCVNETLTMGREPQRKRCCPLVRFLSYIIFCRRTDILQIILIRHLINQLTHSLRTITLKRQCAWSRRNLGEDLHLNTALLQTGHATFNPGLHAFLCFWAIIRDLWSPLCGVAWVVNVTTYVPLLRD